MRIPLLILASLLVLASCSKDSGLETALDLQVDPAQADVVNRLLQLQGTYTSGAIPKKEFKVNGNGLRWEDAPLDSLGGTQSRIDMSQGVKLYFPFRFFQNGSPFNLPPGFTVCEAYVKVKGSSAYWRVPVKANTDGGDPVYYFDLLLPRMVKEKPLAFTYSVKICGKTPVPFPPYPTGADFEYITDSSTTQLVLNPVLGCGDTLHARTGLTIRKYILGSKKGNLNLRLFTGTVGDRIDIKQGDKYIFSTGSVLPDYLYPKCKGTNSTAEGFIATGDFPFSPMDFTIPYDPAKGNELTLYGLGSCNDSSTEWYAILTCPK